MRELKVTNGEIELHGEIISVNEEDGEFVAVDSFDIGGLFHNEIFQFAERPALDLSPAYALWMFGGKATDIGCTFGIGIEQCKTEVYKLNFDGGL